MGTANFSGDFKRYAVAQITERGYAVAEGSRRLGVRQHSLYTWRKKFSQPSGGDVKDAEIKRLKGELVRVTKERDILKKLPRISPRMQSEIRVHCRASPGVLGACDVSLPRHPSDFYAWHRNPLSERAREDARQTELIRKAWKDSGKVYGYRKLHDDLLNQGET